jgi:hypothetical protein
LRKLKDKFGRNQSQPVGRVVKLINPVLRGWVNYFAVGHSSECFSFVKDWVEKKIKRHMQRARNRQGFGWTRWSREWTPARQHGQHPSRPCSWPRWSGACDGTQRRLRRAMKLALDRDQAPGMIRVALTDAAYHAIASTLPKGAARWPMQRDRNQCFIQVEAAVVDRMRAMRRPGESYSQVILRLVELETSDLK